MKKLFVFLIILFGITFVISAQTSECDSLINEIKAMAEIHVNNNENMKTELIVSLYKDNSCGLSQVQIAKTYQDYYQQAKQESANIWNNLKPKADWFYYVLIFLLGIFVMLIRKWIANIFKKISSYLYSKLSGSKIFRRKAIRKYKKALFDNYKEVKITFRQGKPLNMADIFIPLKAIDSAENTQLEIEQSISNYNKFVVLGDPGSGKSMFCKNILFKYSQEQLKHDKIPVLVELHRLSDKSSNIMVLLEKELAKNDFPNSSKFLTQCLKSGKLLILFDGYDEINSTERNRVTESINDFIKENRNCQYVITSRVAVYKDEFKEVTEKTLKLIDFDQQQIRKFLNSWTAEMPEGKSIEQLMQILQDRPKILLLATNPLMLTIVAYMYTDTPHVLPHSRSEFYDQATNVLLSPKQGCLDNYSSREKKLILQHLALNSLEGRQDKEQDRKLIPFTKAFEEIKKILLNINRLESDIQPILDEIVERSGLLLTVDNGEYYQFAHLTMQEYFAAKQLIDRQEDLLFNFEKDKQTWRETVKLWCGLANDTTFMISKLYKIDPLIAFECIADAGSIKPEVADEIIFRFESILTNPTECNEEIEKAFGVLASENKERGQKILEKLEDKMKLADTKKQISIANALAYTYLPKAASIISPYCSENQELYKCLIRMGDIAIPELLRLAKDYNDFTTGIITRNAAINALLGIKQISTPKAAFALLSFIWYGFNKYAAWFLADIIFTPNIINELRNYKLNQTQLIAPRHDWAWEPFKEQEPSGSNLSFIIGRIVYLMSLPIEFSQEIKLEIDERIAIPVAINKYDALDNETWKTNDILKSNTLGLCKEEINFMKQHLHNRYLLHFNELPDYCFKYNPKYDLKYDYYDYKKDSYSYEKQGVKINDFLLKFINREKYPIFFMMPNVWLSQIFKVLGEKATKEDWKKLSLKDKKLNYDFDTSWHYRIIFIIFSLLSISSIIFCGYSIWHNEHFSTVWNLIQRIGWVIMISNFLILYKLFTILDKSKYEFNEKTLSFEKIKLMYFDYKSLLAIFFGFITGFSDIRQLPTVIWTPFLLYYNYLLLSIFLPITGVLIVASIVVGTCISLAVIGKRIEKRADNPLNPLKELLLEKK